VRRALLGQRVAQHEQQVAAAAEALNGVAAVADRLRDRVRQRRELAPRERRAAGRVACARRRERGREAEAEAEAEAKTSAVATRRRCGDNAAATPNAAEQKAARERRR